MRTYIRRTPTAGKLTYSKVKMFDNRYFDYQNWMHIPQSDMVKNTKLVQNTG